MFLQNLNKYASAINAMIIVIIFSFANYAYSSKNQEQIKEEISYLISANEFMRALALLDNVIGLIPDNAELYRNKGYCLLRLNKFTEAIETYNKAIELDPYVSSAYTNKAASLFGLGKYKESLIETNKALEISVDNEGRAENLHHLCGALTSLEQFDKALEACNEAIRLDPFYAEIYGTRAATLYGLKRYKDSLNDCDKGIELNPNIAGLYYNKGVVLRKLHRELEAVESFKKATKLKGYKL